MPQHHDDPLTTLIKTHPVGYFVVMFLLALGAGTVIADLVQFLDIQAGHFAIGPKYVAAVLCALGAHAGLSWRRKRRQKS